MCQRAGLHIAHCDTQTVTHHLQFPLQGKRLISCSLVSDLLMELSLGCRSVPCCHTPTKALIKQRRQPAPV